MTAKTPKKKKAYKNHSKDSVLDSALAIASVMPWDALTLHDIAQESGITLAQLRDMYDDKADILSAFGRRIDRIVLDSMSTPDPAMAEKDRLFDVMMERFDALQTHRAAVISIVHSFARDPKQAVISLPHLARSMTWMMESAGLSTDGISGAIRVLGLCVVYLSVLRTWAGDESADLSVTMSALDKTLSRAEQIAGILPL